MLVMKRTPRSHANSALNFLHKGFVLSCLGVTLFGTTYLGYRFFKYVFVSLPEYKEKKRLEDQLLLSEGSSDNLRDSAPSIS